VRTCWYTIHTSTYTLFWVCFSGFLQSQRFILKGLTERNEPKLTHLKNALLKDAHLKKCLEFSGIFIVKMRNHFFVRYRPVVWGHVIYNTHCSTYTLFFVNACSFLIYSIFFYLRTNLKVTLSLTSVKGNDGAVSFRNMQTSSFPVIEQLPVAVAAENNLADKHSHPVATEMTVYHSVYLLDLCFSFLNSGARARCRQNVLP